MRNGANIKLVTIGASAGAIDALGKILPALPRAFSPAIAIVVHLPEGQISQLPEVLGYRCQLPVKEVEDKEPIEGGVIYVAPPGYHLMVESEGFFSLGVEEPVNFSRPSIDVLFESAAEIYGENLLGIVLTGANDDGAAGLASIKSRGGSYLVQDPKEAGADSMPVAALRAVRDPDCAASLQKIAQTLLNLEAKEQ